MSQPDEARDYFRALFTVAQAAVSSLELEEVLSNIARGITEALHIKGAGLRLLSSDRQTLGMRKSYGLSDRYVAKGPVAVAQSPIDQETLRGRVVIIPRVGDDPRFQYPRAAEQEGIVSVLAVPLQAKGEAIGVLRAYTGKPHEFTQQEIEFVQAVADLAALAIVNARLYEASRREFEDMTQLLWGTHRDQ
jgi:GAF domain-containing protein